MTRDFVSRLQSRFSFFGSSLFCFSSSVIIIQEYKFSRRLFSFFIILVILFFGRKMILSFQKIIKNNIHWLYLKFCSRITSLTTVKSPFFLMLHTFVFKYSTDLIIKNTANGLKVVVICRFKLLAHCFNSIFCFFALNLMPTIKTISFEFVSISRLCKIIVFMLCVFFFSLNFQIRWSHDWWNEWCGLIR